MSMYSTVETITPDIARKYLERNIKNNRNISSKVNEYAADMRNGKWQLTSQGITFNEKGELTDGQHRLSAIIKANVPVKMYVTYGEPCNATIHDRGRSRSTADIALMGNMFPECEIPSRIKKYIGVARVLLDFAGFTKPTDTMTLEFLQGRQPKIKKATEICDHGNTRNLMGKASCAGAVYCAMECGVRADVLYSFCNVVNTGFQESADQKAAILVRNLLVADKMIGARGYRKKELCFICFAIKDFERGIPRTRNYKDKNPEMVPYISEVMGQIKEEIE